MIAFQNVDVVFGKSTPLETHALRNFSLTVSRGEFITVIGSNGAGKSTVLNALSGYCPIDSGTIFLGEKDITYTPSHQRARYIARVFQDPLAGTCETLTIEENMALAAHRRTARSLRMASNTAMRTLFADKLKRLGLGLEKRLHDRIGLLSGGQRQAVSLLMASLAPMDILLLDEHTAALDPKTAAFVLALTEEIIEEQQLTALMVTHSMKQALSVGTRTLMLHQGRIIFDVRGEERTRLTVQDLLQQFDRTDEAVFDNDALLLDK